MRLVIGLLLAIIVLLAVAGWGDAPDTSPVNVPVEEPDQPSPMEFDQ